MVGRNNIVHITYRHQWKLPPCVQAIGPNSVLYSFSLLNFDSSWSTIITTITITRSLITTTTRNNFNNESWLPFGACSQIWHWLDLVLFSFYHPSPYTKFTHLPEMMSPTTMLADDIVGWYTRTSTSAVISLCRALILHTKRKKEKQMNKEWYKRLADTCRRG